ncbi:MAG: hypothetical protein ACRD4O_06730 [Bryobacteraceae bacterium]
MPEPVFCKICQKRRARRYCPAVGGDICPLCCGTHREIDFTCPLDCEFLQEAHRHEKPVPPAEISYPDVELTEEFLNSHQELFYLCAGALVEGALGAEGAVDADLTAALEALIQTQRTLESGLFYETRAENTVAAAIQRSASDALAEYRKLRSERDPLSPVRNNEILGVLVFLHRLGGQNRSGRPRGRMYLDLLRGALPSARVEEPSRIIL